MVYIIDTARAMTTTIRNVFRKPATIQFPKEIRKRPERFRTSFALLHDEHGEELCIGCLACDKICPSRIIKVIPTKKRESPVTGKKRGYSADFTLDMNACIYCELCVQVCPTDSIVMLKEQEQPAYSREELCLTMDKLYANEEKVHSWGTGKRLVAMQNPKRLTAAQQVEADKVAAEKAAAKKLAADEAAKAKADAATEDAKAKLDEASAEEKPGPDSTPTSDSKSEEPAS